MARWTWKRWVAVVLAGVVVAAAAATPLPGQTGGPKSKSAAPPLSGSGATDGPRPNDTLTIKFPGQPERKVVVLGTTRQPDGSVATEVKDPATGETFTLVDSTTDAVGKPDPKPAAKAADKSVTPTGAKDPGATRPKLRPNDPPAADAEPRKGLFGGSKPAAAPSKAPDPPAESGKRPGLFSRIFGKKSNPSADKPAMPAVGQRDSGSMPRTAAPSLVPPSSSGATAAPPLFPGSTGEPPRSMPSTRPALVPPGAGRVETVVPPTPIVPSPMVPVPMPPAGAVPRLVPSSPPAVSTPVPAIPAPLPGPMPTTPSVPVPSIPIPPPGGAPQAFRPADGGPIQRVLQAGYTSPEVAMHQDIRPYVATLTSGLAPSERMLAARGLADGRHGSTDQVKAVLFQAARTDPCPAVKACCIDQLCKLGYYNPAFLAHLKASWDDPNDDVRNAARVALYKMTPRK